MRRRLLILGASPFQVPAIRQAVAMGCHVITCDYLPDNPGHQFAHRTFNISTTDREAVLQMAMREDIDGVLAYASDPAAPTAAHVAARMGLPGNDPESVHILTHKPSFRAFLRRHGFQVPAFSQVRDCDQATAAAGRMGYPMMVKPADSSGSKGVNRIDAPDGLPDAVRQALAMSRVGEAIVEGFLPRHGRQIAGDGLVIDGRLAFFSFADEHFDEHCSPFAPVGETFPGTTGDGNKRILLAELQRLFGLLGMTNLVFNLDAAFDERGRLFFIDIGPRAGGNFIPQAVLYHSGIDLTECAIRIALGMHVEPPEVPVDPRGYFATAVIHSRRAGRLRSIDISDEIQSHVIHLDVWAKPGDRVSRFRSSRDALGCALLSFSSRQEMDDKFARLHDLLLPVVSDE